MAILLEDGEALLLEDGTALLLESGDEGVSPTYPDDWALQNEGPRTIRQLYHWAWKNFNGIATYLGTSLKQYLNDLQAYLVNLIFERTRWMGAWVAGEYVAKDQVLDGSWLMIANKNTTERAAPQPQGSPFNVYPADNTTTQQVTASQIIFGQRYTGQSGTLRITGYRIYTVIGNTYRVFVVEDPLSATPVVSEVALFTANNAGWQNFAITGGNFIPSGKQFDLIAFVAEPDPSPTTFTGEWNYSTPQNPTIPAAGQIQHSRATPSVMEISTTDSNAGDRYAELAGLDFGDIIDDGVVRWAIQSVTDNTTYFTFGVSPAVNSAIGLKTFTFETVTPTPISYEQDLDYWTGNALVQGLFGADVPYDQIVADESQYGIDMQLQNYDFSPDWDVQAVTGTGGSGATQQLTVGEIVWVASQASAFNVIFGQASGPTWQEIGRRTINDGEGWRVEVTTEAKMVGGFGYATNRLYGMVSRDGGTLDVDYVTAYEHSTDPLVETRVEQDGNDVVFEARTPAMETWNFKVISYFNEVGDLL